MKKFNVWQPIASGFEIEVEAETEDEAIDLVIAGEFDCLDDAKQILENQQLNGMPEIMEE